MADLSPDGVSRSLSAKKKREKAAIARARGRTWVQVADEAGYTSPGTACKAVQDYFAQHPTEDAEQWRAQENMKLDYLEQSTLEMRDKNHVVVQNGKVVTRFVGWLSDEDGHLVRDPDGRLIPMTEEIPDDGPVERANALLLRIYERRARLNGLDTMVVKAEIDDHTIDNEIEDLVSQFAGPAEVPQASNETVAQ